MRRAFAKTLSLAALLASGAPCQDPAEPPVHERQMQAWLESDHSDRELLEDAVEAILDAGRRGLESLARAVRETPPDDRERRIGVDSLLANVAVGSLDRARESGLIFAGQFDDLRLLQPEIGRFLVGLVLDTPEWFPEDRREQVVPALRDIYPKGPGPAVVERLAGIVRDRDHEAQSLRDALAFALAQWGRREFVAARIDELARHAGEGRTADELHFVRELAEVHYLLRDYAKAADHWRTYLEGTRANGGQPSTLDLYNAACSMALAGRIDPALDAIEQCTERLGKGEVDTTQEFTREMFETDPDLRALRSLPRFQAAVEAAFPTPADAKQKPDER